MNIQLPEKFFYSDDWKRLAYVEDGILYVEGDVNFENLMYTLAYQISGYETCYYCGRKLTLKSRTLDHMFPRCWGGISIPDNLVPCCYNCNIEKSSMSVEQYERWKTIDNSDDKAKVFAKYAKCNEIDMQSQFMLPWGWLSEFEVSTVIDQIDFEQIERFGNDKVDLYYELHGHYPRPLVVSSNNWVFKGIHMLYHAKVHGIRTMSCIRLDNVVRIKE